jgi:hypothetical protein
MSRKDAVVLASRTLASLLGVWAFAEVCSLPEMVHSFVHYMSVEPSASIEHLRHYHVIRLGFAVTRLLGFSLMARWLFRGGPEVEELLLPSAIHENAI